MKQSRLLLIALLVSAYATVSVINIQLAKPKDVSEVTLDMLDIMSRAFDESEGGEVWIICSQYGYGYPEAGRCWDPTDCERVWTGFGGYLKVQRCMDFSGRQQDLCIKGHPCWEPS